MRDIFVSYTSSDRAWAHWIAAELRTQGHEPHVHEWEINAGGNILEWMEQHHDAADHVLCVVSAEYLKAPYSTLERQAAVWRAAKERSDFVLFVVVKPCALPSLIEHFRRCELFGLPDDAARQRFREFMTPRAAPAIVAFPGEPVVAHSNISITVPRLFLGRDADMAAIEAALARYGGRAAITALRGMRGVGKTVLAAAFADKHRHNYRATWWLRAETPEMMRTDLSALSYRLGWVAQDAGQEDAIRVAAERLRAEGEGILLIFDNAADRGMIAEFLPRGGAAQVLITSNAHNWTDVAEEVEILTWPCEIGADFLLARTGDTNRATAEALSEALGGLPLAHEMAGAYCKELGLTLNTYAERFAATPAEVLDDPDSAPIDYHNRRTVAKTFALAIDAAAQRHEAAEPLLAAAALLPPEPVPLFLLDEGRERLAEGLGLSLAGRGRERAIAALRRFGLVELETVVDERDPVVTTQMIRLHTLIRMAARWRRDAPALEAIHAGLIAALVSVFPSDVFTNPGSWPRARQLGAIVLGMADEVGYETGVATAADRGLLFDRFGSYSHATGDFRSAQRLFRRALAIREAVLDADHPLTATSLNNLAHLLRDQGNLAAARPLYERALAINEKGLGDNDPNAATPLNNLGVLLQDQGDLDAARCLYERALAIRETFLGVEHPSTAESLNNLGSLLSKQGDFPTARRLLQRALAILKKVPSAEPLGTANVLNNLADVRRNQGDLAAARRLFEDALGIMEKFRGAEHPHTAAVLTNIAGVLRDQGELAAARPLCERALAIREKVLGVEHLDTAQSLDNLAYVLWEQGDSAASRRMFDRALAIQEKVPGSEHRTAIKLNNLGRMYVDKGDLAAARPLFERALTICEKTLGPGHRDVAVGLNNVACLLRDQGDHASARPLIERALEISERVFGSGHPQTQLYRRNLASLRPQSFRSRFMPKLR